MSYITKIAFEPLRSFNSATLNGTFQALGTPFAHEAYIIKMTNNSTALVTIALDGVTAVDVCPGNSFWLYDLDTSGSPSPEALPVGTQVYINGTAGTGNIYLTLQYIQQR